MQPVNDPDWVQAEHKFSELVHDTLAMAREVHRNRTLHSEVMNFVVNTLKCASSVDKLADVSVNRTVQMLTGEHVFRPKLTEYSADPVARALIADWQRYLAFVLENVGPLISGFRDPSEARSNYINSICFGTLTSNPLFTCSAHQSFDPLDYPALFPQTRLGSAIDKRMDDLNQEIRGALRMRVGVAQAAHTAWLQQYELSHALGRLVPDVRADAHLVTRAIADVDTTTIKTMVQSGDFDTTILLHATEQGSLVDHLRVESENAGKSAASHAWTRRIAAIDPDGNHTRALVRDTNRATLVPVERVALVCKTYMANAWLAWSRRGKPGDDRPNNLDNYIRSKYWDPLVETVHKVAALAQTAYYDHVDTVLAPLLRGVVREHLVFKAAPGDVQLEPWWPSEMLDATIPDVIRHDIQIDLRSEHRKNTLRELLAVSTEIVVHYSQLGQ